MRRQIRFLNGEHHIFFQAWCEVPTALAQSTLWHYLLPALLVPVLGWARKARMPSNGLEEGRFFDPLPSGQFPSWLRVVEHVCFGLRSLGLLELLQLGLFRFGCARMY